MIEDEIRRLESKHKELDIAIKKDYSNYLSDAHMVKMKQEKLQLKDKIAKLKEV